MLGNTESTVSKPGEVEKALTGPRGKEWRVAMDNEFHSLTLYKTWSIVPRTPNMKTIKPKWVLKRKLDEDVPKFKARLVARGFTQRAGVDYFDTFSPVIRITSVRLILSYALQMKMEIHHIDVKNAYLNANLDQTIYMEQPEHYTVKDPKQFVCKLNRSLYGLKQSAKCWNLHLSSILSKFGFTSFACEPCMFANKDRTIIIGAYVDDLLVAAERPQIIEKLVKRISSKLNITYKGRVKNFLGINFEFGQDRLTLDQSSHIQRLLEAQKLLDCKGVNSPIAPGTIVDPVEDDEFTNITSYQSIVGSLLHIANFTRPDISYVVGQLCRFMSAPRVKHYELARRVLKYLKQTKDARLIYKQNDFSIRMYSDADHKNGTEMICTSGGMVFLCGNLTNWWSQRQQVVAISSMEAEINAVCVATKEASYLRKLLYELNPKKFHGTIPIFCDNKSAAETSHGGGNFARTKHYILTVNFVQKCVDLGIIEVPHKPAEEMLADALTKPLTTEKIKSIITTSGFSLG